MPFVRVNESRFASPITNGYDKNATIGLTRCVPKYPGGDSKLLYI